MTNGRNLYGEDSSGVRYKARYVISSGETHTKKIPVGIEEDFVMGRVLLVFVISKFVSGQMHCTNRHANSMLIR